MNGLLSKTHRIRDLLLPALFRSSLLCVLDSRDHFDHLIYDFPRVFSSLPNTVFPIFSS